MKQAGRWIAVSQFMLGSGLNSQFAPLDIGSATRVSLGILVHEWRDGWNHMYKPNSPNRLRADAYVCEE
jgi:hypothetical protein